MRLGHWLSVMILASSVAAAPACSDDDDTTGAGGSGGTGGSGTAGRGGAGQGGAAGSSGRGPDAAGGTGGSGGTGGAAGAAGSTGGQAGSAGRDGGGTAGSAGTAGRGGQTADAGDAPDAITLTDGQIVGVVHAANLGEIQAGMLAETRAVVGDVRTFATRMDNEHTAADRALLDLAADAGSALTPTESPLSNQLTATAMQKLQALQPLQGIVFDRAYMNDQVEMHSQVLTLLNDLLIASAMNAALRTQLMTVRESVMMHLAQARLVQQAISSDAGDGGDGAADAADGDVGADGDGRDGATDADAAMDVSDDRMGDGSDGG